MEINPYESPKEQSMPVAAGVPDAATKLRRFVFVGLGTAAIIILILPAAAILFESLNIALGFAALFPIGLLGVATIVHGLKPSKATIWTIVLALGLLTIDIVILIVWANR